MTRMLSANSGALFLPADVSIKLAIAIGIGLLVGLEREWSHKELGARTFTIVSMDGALSVLAGNAIVFLAFGGILIIVLLAGLGAMREVKPVETTTFVAVIVTFILGLLVGEGHRYTPVAAAIVMTMLLSLKPALKQFAWGLQVNEIRSAVLLGLLAFVIYPVLPGHAIGPQQLVNPREAWLTVVLIAALGFLNYVLLKLFHSRGLYYTAVLGGMVNSTAAIAELSRYLRELKSDPTAMAITIDLLTVIAMFLRNLLILTFFVPRAAIAASGPLMVMGAASLAILWHQRKKTEAPVVDLKLGSPLSLPRVLKFGLIFLVIEIIGTLGQQYFGHFGFLLVSIFGGLVSSASTTGAAASLAMHGSITPQMAGTATVLTSMTSALSNLPILHQQLHKPVLSRKLIAISLAIVLLGLLATFAVSRIPGFLS